MMFYKSSHTIYKNEATKVHIKVIYIVNSAIDFVWGAVLLSACLLGSSMSKLSIDLILLSSSSAVLGKQTIEPSSV